jgi:hypothetical protein
LSFRSRMYFANQTQPEAMRRPTKFMTANRAASRTTLACLRCRNVQNRLATHENTLATTVAMALAHTSLPCIGPVKSQMKTAESMTNATPPTAPNFATSRQKSEASPLMRSASVLIMTLHGRVNTGADGPSFHFSPFCPQQTQRRTNCQLLRRWCRRRNWAFPGSASP